MTWLRRHAATHRGFAALLLAAALLARLLVPAGFMPDVSAGRVAVVLCGGAGPVAAMAAMPGIADHLPEGMGHPRGEHPPHDAKPAPCGFGALASPGLAGADPVQLGLALRHAFAAALFAAPLALAGASPRLRPPSRAPPAYG